MNSESRVYKSLRNARVSLLFYALSVIIAFFSRKVFLESLGADFIGLGGTISDILGFLSLAELGVAAATSYHLYKPLQEGNKERINELISVIGFLYRRIGLFVIGAGVVISLFIPIIFGHTIFKSGIVYFGFYCILFSSACTYLINYKQIILSADQKNYVVTGYLQTANIANTLIQMAVAYYLHNYYLWFGINLVFTIIACIILNKKIRKTYPWLDATVKKGEEAYSQNKELMSFTKKVFVHKLKDFLLNRSDQIMVFAFVSLKMVAYYGNYTIIVNRLSSLFSSVLDSFSAGVGNLVAEGDKKNQLKVFWEITALRFFVGGVLVFSIYSFTEPFITVWLGEKYVLNHWVLVLLMINTFIIQSRGAVDMFNSAYGNYGDVWAAWAEGGINLGVTLATAPFIGVSGILLGKIISLLLIVVIWKPIYLFRDGFQLRIGDYWKYIVRYYGAFALSMVIGFFMVNSVPINEYSGFGPLVLKAIICVGCFVICYVSLLYWWNKGFRDIMSRIIK